MSDERIEKAAQAIRETCERLCAFLLEKNAAYGNSAFEPVGVFCKADAETLIRARLDDKISRLQRGQAAGEDAELDALGYLLLLRALPRYRELCAAPDAEARSSLAAVGVRLRHKASGWTGEITRREHDSFVVCRDSDGVKLPYTWSQYAAAFDVEPFEARASATEQAADPWQPGVEVERIAESDDQAGSGNAPPIDVGNMGRIAARVDHPAAGCTRILVRSQRDGLVWGFSLDEMQRLFRVVEPKEGAKP